MAAAKKGDGKWLEGKLQDGFKELQKRLPLRLLRLFDSHSAGLNAGNANYLPEQDGDFILIGPLGQACLLECKETVTHPSLSSWLASAVSPNQRASHRWWYRAGAASVFVHYSHKSKVLEVWWGKDVFEARNEGVALKREQALLQQETKPEDVEGSMIEVLAVIEKLRKEKF